MAFRGLFVYMFLIGIMELFAIKVAKQSQYITLSNGIIKDRSFLRWEIIIPLILFAVIFGMRWNVGWDHIPYLYAYVYDDIERFEIGFRSITRLFQNANIHYVYYFAFWSFIQVYLFFLSFKKEYYLFPFLVILIFTQSEVSFWINGMRQALAICFILYSITYIENRKPISYLLFGILAISFHRSAIIIVILLYPLLVSGKCYFKNRYIQYILLGLAFVIHNFIFRNDNLLENLLNIYNDLIGYVGNEVDYTMESMAAESGDGRIGFVYIIRLIEVIIIITYSPKMQKFFASKRFNMLYNLFVICYILAYLVPDNINIIRMFRYFYIFRPIMLSYLCYYLYKTNNSNRILSYTIISVDILGWVGGNIKNGWSFDFFFEHDINDIMLYLD